MRTDQSHKQRRLLYIIIIHTRDALDKKIQSRALKHELDEFNTCNALTEGVSDRVAQSVHGFDIPDVFSKAFDDVKTAHVQEINSLELEIESMQHANNAMRIPRAIWPCDP